MQRTSRPARSPADPPRGFDATRLQRLLQLVGPDQAPALLVQLRLDLTSCDSSISHAAAGPDWKALREASHVLISLAGSAGAMALHDQAQALNAAAHDRDPALLHRLLPALQSDLTALIALIKTTPAEVPR